MAKNMFPNADPQTNAGSAADATSLLTRSETSSGAPHQWVRIHEAQRLFGLGRTFIYELISSGAVKSFALRKKDKVRGIRLLSYSSLVAYCEKAADAALTSNTPDEKEAA